MTVTKRGKTCAKGGKTRVRQVTVGSGLSPDWLKKQHVCSDWLVYVEQDSFNQLPKITVTCVSQLKLL